MGKLDGFLEYIREEVPNREIAERVKDYREVEGLMPWVRVRNQAARCMDCGIPFCQGSGCPLGTRIPDMNDRLYKGRWKEAAELLFASNNLPEITGRVCPGLCESACTLGISGDPVTIRHIERQVADRAFEEGWIRPQPPATKTGKIVAVIGSGPAGLAAAQQLARMGHKVRLFEKDDKPGGLLRYGIPDFKLEKTLIDRRLEQMTAEGVHFETGVTVGEDLSAQYLMKHFHAIVLALGAGVPRDLDVPGRGLGNVVLALDYLVPQIRRNSGELVPGMIDAQGKRVLVIGGGDTGSDCVGTAVRQGAASVTQIEVLPCPPKHRPAEQPWPAWAKILKTSTSHEEAEWAAAASTEPVRRWGVTTEALEGTGGVVTRWVGKETATGKPLALDVDLVVLAMGFLHVAHHGLVSQFGLALDARGNIRTAPDGTTSVPGIFAAGDAALGASLVVKAIHSGRLTAAQVGRHLA